MTELPASVVSIRDFDRGQMLHVLDVAAQMEGQDHSGLLSGKVLGLLFFEPSTRTRLSFASAMMRLGGEVLDFGEPQRSSSQKGETLADTVRIVSAYCDVMAIRHKWEGAARLAAQLADVPVINQTFLDLYTIRKVQGRIEGLNIGFLGDLKYSRTVHSLAGALAHFGCRQCFISPPSLRVPPHVLDELRERGVQCEEYEDAVEVLSQLDILYCTRIQEERFADRIEYEKVRGIYRVDRQVLEEGGARPSLRVMHPLPRVDELSPDLDDTPYAVYFEQARNGIPVRQALLAMLLGKV